MSTNDSVEATTPAPHEESRGWGIAAVTVVSLAAVFVVLWGISQHASMVMPAFLALNLVIAAQPLQKILERVGLPRWGAMIIVLLVLYLLLVAVFSVLISAVERLPVMPVVHEVISALATVGFSTGITANLDTFSRICLVILMFVGRLGGFTLMALFGFGRRIAGLQRPEEQVLIG